MIELIHNSRDYADKTCESVGWCEKCHVDRYQHGHHVYCEDVLFADYLIANGATVLPCQVGQEVWLVFTPKHPAYPRDKGKWFMRQDGVQRVILGKKGFSIETWNMGTIPAKEIGKKLFFTYAEAKAALEAHDNYDPVD